MAHPFDKTTHPLIGMFVQLDDPDDSSHCTISRIDHALTDRFFLARRFGANGRELCDHVISLSMLAVHDGAELHASYEAAKANTLPRLN